MSVLRGHLLGLLLVVFGIAAQLLVVSDIAAQVIFSSKTTGDMTAARWDSIPSMGRDAAEYDLSLTKDLYRYATDVRTGRTRPKEVYKDVDLPVIIEVAKSGAPR